MKTLAVAARIPELEQGRVDILLAELTETPERAKVVDYSHPYFVTGAKVMVKKAADIKGIDDLAGRKISTTKGSTMEQNLREELPTARSEEHTSELQSLMRISYAVSCF